MSSKKTALIIGATALVGRQVLNVLLDYDYYDEIILLGRRSPEVKDNRIREVIIDFETLESHANEISANDYYCCIGTTMKAAGSEEAFKRVDYTYPLELGKMALKDPNFEQFLLVSSFGADSKSILFYNKVKGHLEDEMKTLSLKRLHVFQPSLLLGYRPDFRFFEELAKITSNILSFFVIGESKRFWAIEGHDVAKSMFLIARQHIDGTHTYRPQEMLKITHEH
jgi:uncharacterized protein YbjT (DUF2867 family)